MVSRIGCLFLLGLVGIFQGFSAPRASQLVFVFADDEAQVTLTDAGGKTLQVAEGVTLTPGATLRTKNTTAEFRLEPNGSALKLGKNTTFRVRSFETLGGAGTNGFTVLIGKVRLIAARVAGVSHSYEIQTPGAQAGVRGTFFAVEANAKEGDWVCVKEGVVEFARTKAGKVVDSILVADGQFANVRAAQFQARVASPEVIADKFEDLDFHTIHEGDVPGHQPATTR